MFRFVANLLARYENYRVTRRPSLHNCPSCGKSPSYDEWDGGYCGRCGWDATTEQIAHLREIGDHASADYIEFGATMEFERDVEIERFVDEYGEFRSF